MNVSKEFNKIKEKVNKLENDNLSLKKNCLYLSKELVKYKKPNFIDKSNNIDGKKEE